MADRFRFGDFDFDPASGELRSGTGGRVHRLAPQPARLLAMLAERRGQLVSRDEIRARIWPGVEVEFETSLHFCIRQIRAALGESATDPRYVETLPRRGYRLITPVESADARPVPSRRWAVAVGVLLVSAVVTLALVGPGSAPTPPAEPRIAIMPFEPAPGTAAFEHAGPIADWILERLTAGDPTRIVGPSTTVAYGGAAGGMQRLAEDYRLDYIVNGRFMTTGGADDGPRMLAELIRVSDGAHVWVRAYEDLRDGRRIGMEISDAVVDELGLAN